MQLLSKINLIVFISFCLLFFSSVYRHYHYGSNALDLGVFDQAMWLLSTNQTPKLTLINKHLLADHGAWILYPLSIFYKIYPTVLWLFFLQALSFSYAAKIIYRISSYLGAKEKEALLFSLVYLLAPTVFAVNSFDFHPDVLAFCLMLLSYEFIIKEKLFLALLTAILACGFKEFFCLAVFGLGLFLLTKKKYFKSSLSLLVLSLVLAIFSIIFFIPYFSQGAPPSGMNRFLIFGETPLDAILNILKQPALFFNNFYFTETTEFLLKLIIPFIFLFHYKNLKPLIGLIPVTVIYALSDTSYNRQIYYQYALIPLFFLLLLFFEAIHSKKYLFKNKYLILLISSFYLISPYYRSFKKGENDFSHNWKIKNSSPEIINKVIKLIPAEASVAAPSNIVPHLSQRREIYFLDNNSYKWKLSGFDYILLNEKSIADHISFESQNKVKKIMEANVLSKEAERVFAEDGLLLYKMGTVTFNRLTD